METALIRSFTATRKKEIESLLQRVTFILVGGNEGYISF